MQTAQVRDFNATEVVLAVSIELASKSWKLALHDGCREKASVYTVKDEAPLERLEAAVTVITKKGTAIYSLNFDSN